MRRIINRVGKNKDDGFTLIELLVVMIIIGILAAVAIPIFLNQQKTARDSQTITDVKNLANSAQTLLVKHPDATVFTLDLPTDVASRSAATTYTLTVGTATETSTVDMVKTQGTVVGIIKGLEPGTFVIAGYNLKGKQYITTPTAGSSVNPTTGEFPTGTWVVYNSYTGGLKR